jgi:ribonuclease G
VERELIINSATGTVDIALIEESKLVELHKENTSNEFSVGDIYISEELNNLFPVIIVPL